MPLNRYQAPSIESAATQVRTENGLVVALNVVELSYASSMTKNSFNSLMEEQKGGEAHH